MSCIEKLLLCFATGQKCHIGAGQKNSNIFCPQCGTFFHIVVVDLKLFLYHNKTYALCFNNVIPVRTDSDLLIIICWLAWKVFFVFNLDKKVFVIFSRLSCRLDFKWQSTAFILELALTFSHLLTQKPTLTGFHWSRHRSQKQSYD